MAKVLTPEQRRAMLHAEVTQEGPERMLNLLADIVENEDWKQFKLGFLDYIEHPYEEGGVGWSRRNLNAMIAFEMPNEERDKRVRTRMQGMREFVSRQLGSRQLNVIMTGEAGGHTRTAYDAADDMDASDYAPHRKSASRSKLESRLAAERPDIYEAVISGEMSLSAGAVEAGLRTRRINIPVGDPKKTAAALRSHLSEEQIADLVQILLNWDPVGEED